METIQPYNNGLQLFPPLVYKFEYQFDQKTLLPKIRELFDLVKKNSDLEHGDALSTVSLEEKYQPHTWLELMEFQEWLGNKIATIRRDYEFFNTNSKVDQSWVNLHRKGGKTLTHAHTFTTFVVSSYLECPPNSGNIEFLDPLEYHKSQHPIIPEVVLWKQVECKTNDVLIFPGYLKHRTQENITDNERIVMTFNIK